MLERLKQIFKKLPAPRWHFIIALLSLSVALLSLGVAISIPLYFLPNQTNEITHQNTIDFLKTQFPVAQNYDRREEFKDAIDVYQKCLDRVTIRDYREEYAVINMALGQDFGSLSEKENKIQNLQKSIDYFNEALKIFNFDNYPVEYVMCKQQLGANYLSMSEFIDKKGNLEKSIDAFTSTENGLKEIYDNKQVPGHVRIIDYDTNIIGYVTPEEFKTKEPNFAFLSVNPSNFIYTQVDLADAYHDLAVITKNSSYYNQSLESLNNAYMARISFKNESPSVLEKGDLNAYALVKIHEGRDIVGFNNQTRAYGEALVVISPQTNKELFAEIQNGMGTSYFEGDPNNITNIEKSIYHYKLALAYSDKNNPFEYAKILKKLGDSYSDLGTYKDREENFEKAKNAYDTYLTIYTSDYPVPFAETNRDMAILYTMLKDVKNNRTDYETAQNAFDIAHVNGMWNNFSDYESFLNFYYPNKK